MSNPTITIYDVDTGEIVKREMTDDEMRQYAPIDKEPQEETPEKAPASDDDAGAPSTDAG